MQGVKTHSESGACLLMFRASTQQRVPPREWRSKRLKAIKFSLINTAGRIVSHARYLLMQLSAKHHLPDFILDMRLRGCQTTLLTTKHIDKDSRL